MCNFASKSIVVSQITFRAMKNDLSSGFSSPSYSWQEKIVPFCHRRMMMREHEYVIICAKRILFTFYRCGKSGFNFSFSTFTLTASQVHNRRTVLIIPHHHQKHMCLQFRICKAIHGNICLSLGITLNTPSSRIRCQSDIQITRDESR